MASTHKLELAAGTRFAFGENWSKYLSQVSDERVQGAEQSLREMLSVGSLKGKRFLDIGSGSGLFSLAARRLGASVESFDFDPQSVECTRELRSRYFPNDGEWKVQEASILDRRCVESYPQFDVVYSWGVLHHTGNMSAAFENAAALVADQGKLFIAIYNDQGWISRYWLAVKRAYNKNWLLRSALIALHFPYLVGVRWIVRAMTGRLKLDRGMSLWRDMIDWLGGLPFEVATPEAVFQYFHERGFILSKLRTCRGRMGCNEFVFVKS